MVRLVFWANGRDRLFAIHTVISEVTDMSLCIKLSGIDDLYICEHPAGVARIILCHVMADAFNAM